MHGLGPNVDHTLSSTALELGLLPLPKIATSSNGQIILRFQPKHASWKVYRKHMPPGLCCNFISLAVEIVSVATVQSLSCVQLLATPWTVACQAFLSFTTFQSLPKLMSTESMMPSNHLIFCHFLLLLPSIFPSFRVFSNKLVLSIVYTKVSWSSLWRNLI